jgi:hypothetical protein
MTPLLLGVNWGQIGLGNGNGNRNGSYFRSFCRSFCCSLQTAPENENTQITTLIYHPNPRYI